MPRGPDDQSERRSREGDPAEDAKPFTPSCFHKCAIPDRIKNTANSTRPISTTTPSVAVMTPSLANAPTVALAEAQAFHERRGTHRGGSPSITQPRSWIARAGRFYDQTVDQTFAGTPS